MVHYYDLKMPRLRGERVSATGSAEEQVQHEAACREVAAERQVTIYEPRCLRATGQSPLHHRKAVEEIAYFMRWEFRFDFVPYQANDHDRHCRAFLWLARGRDSETHTVIGAACFRWRDEPWALVAHWELHWVWLHPYERQRGLLLEDWPYFSARFGTIRVEDPESLAVQEAARRR